MEIKTEIGTIKAQACFDSKNFPGINLSICRGSKRISLCTLEIDQTEVKPRLKIYVWSPDIKIDEPIFELSEENADKMFEEA